MNRRDYYGIGNVTQGSESIETHVNFLGEAKFVREIRRGKRLDEEPKSSGTVLVPRAPRTKLTADFEKIPDCSRTF